MHGPSKAGSWGCVQEPDTELTQPLAIRIGPGCASGWTQPEGQRGALKEAVLQGDEIGGKVKITRRA